MTILLVRSIWVNPLEFHLLTYNNTFGYIIYQDESLNSSDSDEEAERAQIEFGAIQIDKIMESHRSKKVRSKEYLAKLSLGCCRFNCLHNFSPDAAESLLLDWNLKSKECKQKAYNLLRDSETSQPSEDEPHVCVAKKTFAVKLRGYRQVGSERHPHPFPVCFQALQFLTAVNKSVWQANAKAIAPGNRTAPCVHSLSPTWSLIAKPIIFLLLL